MYHFKYTQRKTTIFFVPINSEGQQTLKGTPIDNPQAIKDYYNERAEQAIEACYQIQDLLRLDRIHVTSWLPNCRKADVGCRIWVTSTPMAVILPLSCCSIWNASCSRNQGNYVDSHECRYHNQNKSTFCILGK